MRWMRVTNGCAVVWDDTTGKGWPWVLTGLGWGDTLVQLGEAPHTTIRGRCHGLEGVGIEFPGGLRARSWNRWARQGQKRGSLGGLR